MRSTLQSLRARRAQNEKGFTLIELLVVVVIIGVLIAIAIPLYLNYQKSSHDKAADSDVRNAVVVMEQCYADNNAYPKDGVASITAPGATLTLDTDGCDGQINVSPGSTLKIDVTAADGSTPAQYTITGYNDDGHAGNTYCFASTAGGSVAQQSSADHTCTFGSGSSGT